MSRAPLSRVAAAQLYAGLLRGELEAMRDAANAADGYRAGMLALAERWPRLSPRFIGLIQCAVKVTILDWLCKQARSPAAGNAHESIAAWQWLRSVELLNAMADDLVGLEVDVIGAELEALNVRC